MDIPSRYRILLNTDTDVDIGIYKTGKYRFSDVDKILKLPKVSSLLFPRCLQEFYAHK